MRARATPPIKALRSTPRACVEGALALKLLGSVSEVPAGGEESEQVSVTNVVHVLEETLHRHAHVHGHPEVTS